LVVGLDPRGGAKEAEMDGPTPHLPTARAGLLVCALAVVAVAAGAAGWAWLAVLAALCLFALAAATSGIDSRAPGDWHRAGEP
jgi:hypothetical protein